ncbi:MAG TPA: hypothetical protein VHV78_08155, partial [Gemmatimonadaceae bacterium]|nr:hypothetical protein [Gemmatimonadaceae bacterium]
MTKLAPVMAFRRASWPDWSRLVVWSAAICAVGAASGLRAQALPAAAAPAAGGVSKFLEDSDPLVVTLTLNIKRIRADKDSNPPQRAATIAYTPAGGSPVTVPLRVHTRGIWRLKTCEFPPLRLNFSNATTKQTVFHGLDKPKLVNYCRDD